MCGGLKPALAGAISSPSVEISWPGFAHRVIGELEETTTENMFRRHGSRRRAFSLLSCNFPGARRQLQGKKKFLYTRQALLFVQPDDDDHPSSTPCLDNGEHYDITLDDVIAM
jgi:hypothetical protein